MFLQQVGNEVISNVPWGIYEVLSKSITSFHFDGLHEKTILFER